MRAIAVILVVLSHQGLPFSGSLGVVIFFVLSGFLITSILVREHQRSHTISLRRFYSRRAYRIFPTFYLCWIITIGLMLLQHQAVNWKRAAASFFYLADYARAFLPLSQQGSFPMGISWSLAIEEQFYLLWPITLLWLLRRRKPAWIIGGMILGIWVWRFILLAVFHVGIDYSYNAFDTRADALLIGGLLAVLLLSDSKAVSKFGPLVSSPWIALLPLACLATANCIEVHRGIGPVVQLLLFTLEPVFSGMVLIQWVFWGMNGWTFLELPAIKWIARLSYAIYLYHPTVLGLRPYIHVPHGQRALVMPVVIVVAACSYYGIERPFMRMRDRGREQSVLMDDGIHRSQGDAGSR